MKSNFSDGEFSLNAAYLLSASEKSQWPIYSEDEFAFCGRSNVGKSSLLNFLLNRKSLANVSKKPGSTGWINFYQVQIEKKNDDLKEKTVKTLWVDLPGFGYAEQARVVREKWPDLIYQYFTQRKSLKMVFFLIDSRRLDDEKEYKKRLQEEKKIIDFLKNEVRQTVIPILTKMDQIPKNKRTVIQDRANHFLMKNSIACSVKNKQGRIEILGQILKKIGLL